MFISTLLLQNEIRNGRDLRRLTLGQPPNPYTEMASRGSEHSMTTGAADLGTRRTLEHASTSRGSTRLVTHKCLPERISLTIFRISVREATPEADLYNYDFKDKWEKSVEEGGLPKKYDQYDMNGYRKDHRVKNIKFTSKFDPAATDDSGFG